MLKVSSKSNPSSVAGAIANLLNLEKEVEVQVIGAGSLNQLIKSIIITRGIIAPLGKTLCCIPSFTDINIDGVRKTAIKIKVICQ